MPTTPLSLSPPCLVHACRRSMHPRVPSSLCSYRSARPNAALRYRQLLYPHQGLGTRCATCKSLRSPHQSFKSISKGLWRSRSRSTAPGDEDLLRISVEVGLTLYFDSLSERRAVFSSLDQHFADIYRHPGLLPAALKNNRKPRPRNSKILTRLLQSIADLLEQNWARKEDRNM